MCGPAERDEVEDEEDHDDDEHDDDEHEVGHEVEVEVVDGVDEEVDEGVDEDGTPRSIRRKVSIAANRSGGPAPRVANWGRPRR